MLVNGKASEDRMTHIAVRKQEFAVFMERQIDRKAAIRLTLLPGCRKRIESGLGLHG
jgi:hypothetical protein